MRCAVMLLLAGLAAPAGAMAPVTLECVHVTKSTLKQAPLVRPLFQPRDTAQITLRDDASADIRVAGQRVPASVRLCETGGTWSRACTQARALPGDVLSFYRPVTPGVPVFAIWGRKGARPDELVENVVLRCTATHEASQ